MNEVKRSFEYLFSVLTGRRASRGLPGGIKRALDRTRVLLDARERKLTCAECQEWLPSVVDAERHGLADGPAYSWVQRHLNQCESCASAYLAIVDLALVEETGQLPEAEGVSPPDLSFLPPLAGAAESSA